MGDFLLELAGEEIPSALQDFARKELENRVRDRLRAAQLPFDTIRRFSTPRRLALAVSGLPERAADSREEKRGPRIDADRRAIDGFLRRMGLTDIGQCETRKEAKGTFLFHRRVIEGRATPALLSSIIVEVIGGFPWPKSMRWGRSKLRWIRPLRAVMAVFDGRPIPGKIDTIAFQDHCRGHRFDPKTIRPRSAAQYEKSLGAAHVIVDPERRRAAIEESLARQSAQAGIAFRPAPDRLQHIAGLVEHPCPFIGAIDPPFIDDLPAVVIETVLWTHQRYVPLYDAAGALAPRFAAVADRIDSRVPPKVRQGHERVLRARLTDADFHMKRDRKTSLRDHAERLHTIVFHGKLGSMADKSARLAKIARAIARGWGKPAPDPKQITLAAALAKADLATGTVGEFADLRGEIGAILARRENLPPPVVTAIRDHYRPRDAGDDCPKDDLSRIIGLADRIDSLVGLWGAGEIPGASRDPFALRRTALGIVRLAEEGNIGFSRIMPLIDTAVDAYRRQNFLSPENLPPALLEFLRRRLYVHVRDRGIDDTVLRSLRDHDQSSIAEFCRHGEILREILATAEGIDAVTVYRRAAAILASRDSEEEPGEEPAPPGADERALDDALAAARRAIEGADFRGQIQHYARLRPAVDAFFDGVRILDENPSIRAARLARVRRLRELGDRIADFSPLIGATKGGGDR